MVEVLSLGAYLLSELLQPCYIATIGSEIGKAPSEKLRRHGPGGCRGRASLVGAVVDCVF